jgi:hypothetical protein
MPANLGNLFQNAPTTAGFFTGQQIASDRATEEMGRKKTLQDIMMDQQKYDYNTQANPLLLEKQRLSNTHQGLVNEGAGYDNTIKRDTMGSTIGATNAENDSKTQAAHIKQAEEFERKLGEYAKVAGQLGPMRGNAMAQLMQSSGMDMNHPQAQAFAQALANDPQKLASTIEAMRKSRIEMTADYMKQQSINDTHVKTTGMNNSTQRDLERMRIEAGKYDKKKTSVNVEQRLLMARSAAEKAEVLEQAYQVALAADDTEGAQTYARRAVEARKRAAEDASNRGLATPGVDAASVAGVAAKARPDAVAPIAGGEGAQPTPTPNSPAAIQSGAMQAWGRYEPDKYEYRVGPNGKLQRKPK